MYNDDGGLRQFRALAGGDKGGRPPSGHLLRKAGARQHTHAHRRLQLAHGRERGARERADDVVLEGVQRQSLSADDLLAQAQEGLNIKHDISIAVSRIPQFVADMDAALEAAFPGVRLVNYGHLGDGNLHYNVQAPADADAEDFLKTKEKPINALVYAAVDQYNGSISAEHGIGSLKREKLQEHKSPVALGLMRSIKQALDPHNLMNPGRVLKR